MNSNVELAQTPDQTVIEAERFVLRPLAVSDGGLLERYLGDERVATMTRVIPHPLPPNYIANMLDRAQNPTRTEDIWAIDGSVNGHAEVMGVIKLLRLDRDQCEIRYWVAPAFWNGGIATAAVEAILAANPQGSKDVYAEVFQDNPTSARVLSNAGFSYLGDAETFCVSRNAVIPTWTYVRKMTAA
ncbi:GNAT family N-acetyltransferase [Octadecabacter sp. CECT 8868]|uniref:GNAT family N-acetyltransferase n=1 Tax=Octadecabacter algicola TaxID=2909342 RepID=UPI001F488254|nr:GNAT family protein [Octadecabacter algicola]MCF2903895.1 GNAT family N-acetyltransferase [Octadecabacter algicola]